MLRSLSLRAVAMIVLLSTWILLLVKAVDRPTVCHSQQTAELAESWWGGNRPTLPTVGLSGRAGVQEKSEAAVRWWWSGATALMIGRVREASRSQ